jgi:hypothetical protein
MPDDVDASREVAIREVTRNHWIQYMVCIHQVIFLLKVIH